MGSCCDLIGLLGQLFPHVHINHCCCPFPHSPGCQVANTPPCWLQVEITKVWGDENKRWKLFITRFFDCELCHGSGMTDDDLAKCHASVREHFEFASCRTHRYTRVASLLKIFAQQIHVSLAAQLPSMQGVSQHNTCR